MDTAPTGLEIYPPETPTRSKSALGWVSVALAATGGGAMLLSLVVAGIAESLVHVDRTKKALYVGVGVLWIGGGLLALLGLVFGAVSLFIRGRRELHAVIATIVCVFLTFISVALAVFGMITEHKKSL